MTLPYSSAVPSIAIRHGLPGILLKWAALVLALQMPSPAAPPVAPLANAGSQHFDSATETSFSTSRPDLKYYVFVPADYDPGLKYPMILMLHGIGEVGSGAVTGGPMKPVLATLLGAEYRAKNPCFLVVPQLVNDANGNTPAWWSYSAEIDSILTKLKGAYSIDATRLYVTGESWGGFGTAAYLKNRPDVWAAGAPLCGNADSRPNEKTPVWFFHASSDGTVDSRGSEENVYNMRARGGNPHFTRYTTGGHDSWTPTFGNVRFWDWLLGQRLHAPGGNVISQTPIQFPCTRVLTAQFGSTLSLTGTADPGPLDAVIELAWFSDRIAITSGSGGSWAANSKSFFTTNNTFTAADIGKRLLINDDATDSWTGYKVLACPGAGEIQVDKNISSSAGSNARYRLAPEGSSQFPKTFTANRNWQASGIPLSSGTNVISIIGKTTSWKAGDAGNTWFGRGNIAVNYQAPATDVIPPAFSVSGAEPNVHLLKTASDTVTLSGTASDAGGSVAVAWSTDFNAQGAATLTSGSWSAPNIPLRTGSNRVTLTASDESGNRSMVVLDVQRNRLPVAVGDTARVFENAGGVLRLLDNDSDPDDSPQSLWISDFSPPAHGTLSRFGRALRYHPAPGFRGRDTFLYTISDGWDTSQAAVEVTVVGRPAVATETILQQDFEQSVDIPSYFHTSAPSAGQFNEIKAEADSGGVAISGGALTYTHSAVTSGGTNGAGFTRFTGMAGKKLVEVSFDFVASNPNNIGTTNGLCGMSLGNITALTDYNTAVTNPNTLQSISFINRTTAVGIRGGGGTTYWAEFPYDTPVHLTWVVNGDSVVRSYHGADGAAHALNSKCAALFVDNVLIQANIPQSGITASVINGIRMNYSATMNGMTFSFDNFQIAEVSDLPPNTSAWFRAQANLPADGSGDSRSTAGDGVPDLLKFAFNTAQKAEDLFLPNATPLPIGGTAGLPVLGVDALGKITLSYIRMNPALNAGLTYQVQQSTDLINWSAGVGTSTATSLDATWDRVDWTAGTHGDKMFYRVGVTGVP